MAQKEEYEKVDRKRRFQKVSQMITEKKTMAIIANAIDRYEGQIEVLESAVGALLFGRVCGWQALRVAHSSPTLRRYEKILGIDFREVLDDRTIFSRRIAGVRRADAFGKFWHALGAGIFSNPEAKNVLDGPEPTTT